MNTIRISSGAALCALLAIPVACSSDTNNSGSPEAGTGGETGDGGSGATGNGGNKTTGGAGGAKGGAGGSLGGAGGSVGGSDGGGSPMGGTDGGEPDGSVPDGGEPDATSDGAVPGACTGPADPSKSKICITLKPEMITPVAGDPTLDTKGTFIIDAFDTDNPVAGVTVPLKRIVYPVPVAAGGPGGEASVYDLPRVDIDGLPETAYVRILFVDNPNFFKGVDLTYGMFVGGFDLTTGVVPPPKLRAVALTKGKSLEKDQILFALRKFTTSVALAPINVADDGQGPLSIGAFDDAAPNGHPVLGGVQFPCVNMKKGPLENVTGFVYGTGNFWLVAQLDDFNQKALSRPGSIVALGGGTTGQSAPDTAKITIAEGQYAADPVQVVTLNFVIPRWGTDGKPPFVPYACPVTPPTGDAGADAGDSGN